MDIVTIEMAQDLAKQEWQEYCKAIRENIPNDAEYMKYYKSIKNCLYYLSQGKHIIDLYASMELAGTNEKGQPRLAIAKAGTKEVRFDYSWCDRTYLFYNLGQNWKRRNKIPVPLDYPNIKRSGLKAPVPKVPARFMPARGLKNYHILWEVEDWEVIPKDPILLKQIRGSKHLFAVMAVWDLTDLERAVLRGAVK